MAWSPSGFAPGEQVDLREIGQRLFTDSATVTALFPTTTTVVADAAGVATMSPTGEGVSATGRTSGRRATKL